MCAAPDASAQACATPATRIHESATGTKRVSHRRPRAADRTSGHYPCRAIAAAQPRRPAALRVRRPVCVSSAAAGWWPCPTASNRCRPSCACATNSRCRWWRAAPAPASPVAPCRHERGVLLSLAKFNRILEIDPAAPHRAGATRRAQPGDLGSRRADTGSTTPPTPHRRSPARIGGNVAENSGGVHCLKYGLTVHNIQQLRMVTIDGELLTIGGSGLDAPGYDLLALMTGSEGMLGVIVEVTVKLLPQPRARTGGAGGVRRRGQGGQRGRPHHRRRHHPGRPGDDGPAGDPSRRGFRARRLSGRRRGDTAVRAGRHQRGSLGADLQGARNSHTPAVRPKCAPPGTTPSALIFWKGRKAAFPAVGRISPDYYCMDGTIPRKQLPRGAESDSRPVHANTVWRSPTCFTPATATCTR